MIFQCSEKMSQLRNRDATIRLRTATGKNINDKKIFFVR